MAFAQELNKHIKKDFIIKLPIMIDSKNTPIIDTEKNVQNKAIFLIGNLWKII